MSSNSDSSSSEAPPPDNSSSSSSSESSSPPPSKSSAPAPTKSKDNKNDNGSNSGGSSSSSSGGSPPSPVYSPPTSGNNGGGSSPPPPKSVKSSPSSHGSTDQQEPSATKSGSSKSDSAKKSSSENSGGGSGPDGKLIAGVAVGAGLLIMILICCIARCTRKKKKQRYDYYDGKVGGQYNQSGEWQNGYPNQGGDYMMKVPPGPPAPPGGQGPNSSEMSSNYSGPYRPPMPPPSPNIALGFNKSTFSYEELSAATNGFSEANVLGQGGFGFVHKGVLPNGKEIAVKSLKSGSGQGEREFQAEVEIISRVHHRHLVSLAGYCIAGGQRMLVYEFVPNNNLEYHLHGRGRPVMDFGTRVRIALGSAKGLAYLHEDCHPRIIHRDIKAANILLDFNFEAMVADFGLAKLSSDTHTHVSTRVMGTFGYLAPEYAASGKLTEKSDVFSFGVMLLEFITGRRPVDPYDVMDDSLVDWARPVMSKALEDGNYDQLADPRLERVYNPQDMQRMIACASASIRHSARKRPKMSQIVRALEGDSSLDDLNDAPKAGSGFGSSNSLMASGDYSQTTYNADMQRFKQLALSSQDFGSKNSSNDSSEINQQTRF